jgi:hypothetical protein
MTEAISFKVERVLGLHLDLGKNGQDKQARKDPEPSTRQAEHGGEHDPDSWFV